MGKVKIFKQIATTFFVLCLALVVSSNNVSLSKNPDVAPKVSITSPQDGATVSEDTLNVVVSFGPKEKGKGNVRYIELGLDGLLAAEYENPANIKEGTHTFSIDIKDLSLGEHFLQAFAYLAEKRAGHKGVSEVITFTLEPLPPVPPEEVWNNMKSTLKEGNIEDALTHFSEGSKEKYREIFTLLKNELPRIANEMEEIYLIAIQGNVAEYFIKRVEDGVEKAYFIYFIKDENDNWKIDTF